MHNSEPNNAATPQGPSSAMPTDANVPQQGQQQGGAQQQQQGDGKTPQPAIPGSGGQPGARAEAGGTPPQGANPADSPTTGYEGPVAGPDGEQGVSLTGNDASATGSPEQQADSTAAIASQQSGGAQAQHAPMGEQNPDNWEAKHGAEATRTSSEP